MFNKVQSNKWTATLTDTNWRATGPTKEDALVNLRMKLELMEERAMVFRHIRVPEKNATFVLTYDGCWIYRICHDNGKESRCMMNEQPYASAMEQMMKHIEQYRTA